MNKTTAKMLAILALLVALTPYLADQVGSPLGVTVPLVVFAILVFFFGVRKGTP